MYERRMAFTVTFEPKRGNQIAAMARRKGIPAARVIRALVEDGIKYRKHTREQRKAEQDS